MTKETLKSKMTLLADNFNPPLSDKEILDFCETDYQEEETEGWKKVNGEKFKAHLNVVDKLNFVKYTTKTKLKQEIKKCNEEIDLYMEKKRQAVNDSESYWYETYIEDYITRKEKLNKQLFFFNRRFDGNDKELARQVSIENFIEFNRAGFANCPFHSEKTGSFHKIQGKNLAYCFGCGKLANTIDIVMETQGVDFSKALKIILNK